jgi:DNA modification methylase
LTSPPDKANNHLLGERRQRISTNYATPPVSLTGFEMHEIDLVIQSVTGDEDETSDEPALEFKADNPVSRLGELWTLGRHRLLVGDSRDPVCFDHLMDGEVAEMVFTDPPYNIPICGNVSGLGDVRHEHFVMGVGEMSSEEFVDFLGDAFANLKRHTADGSIHFVCMDWRHLREMLEASDEVYTDLKNLCVWAKSNAGMGNFYRSQHELVFVFKNGVAPHINNFELGQHGRHRSNVWSYAGANSFKEGRLEELRLHPTVKPAGMVADAILDCSNRNGIVLDSFAGSGTTIIAAQQTGRRAYAMDLDPLYVDTAIRRWQAITGEQARLDACGQTFDEVFEQRAEFLGDRQVGDV